MLISQDKPTKQVQASSVQFLGDSLHVSLSDGREVSLPFRRVEWLQWLANATPEQRANWSVDPGGFAIYWPDLDDGIEVCHLLGMQPVN